MGMLVNGKWTDQRPAAVAGRFVRPESQFRDRIGAEGSTGFKAERGRYHLYVAYNCPWAHRTIIFRKLKGLEDIVSISIAAPNDRAQGWAFHDGFPGATFDTVNGFRYLHQAYTAARPDYTGTVTVPALWDRERRTIVNNESPEIIRMFNSAFDGIGAKPGDYYPAPLRAEIDKVNEFVYTHINNGVYRTGFATTQDAYDEAVERVFTGLDSLEQRLAGSRYLAGDTLTEADWRLFVTLVRFDAVYQHLFKCTRRPIASYPNLQNYLLELYQVPGVAETVRLDHIVTGYYSIDRVNPNGVIPKIAELDFDRPHDRARLKAARNAA
ncbi:MAG TPA: glutathione S-transferase family protein [Burkholderiales bacterium]|nr:glutathione S-transferase family protein [Burkholderiales bacterium]